MSGGFFRGTSSEQDTRFSNKQAKLLKSQKFAPELEHLVDITKVKMDVIRPWIANRVTELLGFEDEVLINFIYGLLDGKVVNGKEVQIPLTGFMEKNTVKFMKELWTLLLSAQGNASGVPQQFLDAKEEETRTKKAEADRIANEIQKKKEKESRELEQERLRKMDDGVEMKANNADFEPTSKHFPQRSSSVHSGDDKETNRRNGFSGRSRVSRSPHSVDNSPGSHRYKASRSLSTSKSLSRSRSYSGDRHKSRSISRSPATRGRSISSERVFHSPRRRSIPNRRRHSPLVSPSPPRRSSHSRRRSRSRSRRRSPSLEWRRMRSPYRDISPSPMRRRLSSPVRRHRSPTPIRRRSPPPIRRRSPTPIRHRSPSPIRRRRSPSPVRRRSPSNLRRRSPLSVRHRSPSPLHHGSPSPVWRGRPSPIRRRSPPPARRRSPIPVRRRSPSPLRRRSTSVRRRHWRSPSTPLRRSPSLVRNTSPILVRRKSPGPSRRRSPSPDESSSPSPIWNRSRSPIRRSPVDKKRSTKEFPRENIRTMMSSPGKYPKDRSNLGNKVLTSLASPVGGDRRSTPYESTRRKVIEHMVHDDSSSPHRRRGQKPRHESPATSNKEENNRRGDVDLKSKSQHGVSSHASDVHKQIDSPVKVHEDYSPKRLAGNRVSDKMESRKREQAKKSERSSGKVVYSETSDHQRSPALYKDLPPEGKHRVSIPEEVQSVQRHKSQILLVGKAEKNNQNGSYESGSDDSGKLLNEKKDKRKHKRSERRQMASDDDYSSDSDIEDKKEAKRRRKEEKKLRKEEKRRRREERHRRREQRRAEKLKAKSQNDADSSEGKCVRRTASRRSDDEGAEPEHKKLEIELRNKALESLKAKKGIDR